MNKAGANRPGELKRVVTIGIAGGIGAGKSLVAEELALAGCVVSDSDAQSREVLRQGRALLAPGGGMAMELDSTRGPESAALAESVGYSEVRVHDDLFGRPRYLTARQGYSE